MANISSNKNLRSANKAKKDEFYTQLSDIEKELKYYKSQFKDKIVYCNADDPFESNFFKYFASNFNALGLKKLITTSYVPSPIAGGQLPLFEIEGLKPDGKEPFKIEINEVKDLNGDGAVNIVDVEWLLKRDKNVATPLKGDGDFRSDECIELLKKADIVVTNPPFSLFREYVAQLVDHKKKFLIIGNTNAITYKDIFKLIKEDKLWTGYTNFNVGMFFVVPDDWEKFHHIDENGDKIARVSTSCWFTNLDVKKHKEDIILYKKYNTEEYPKYDNYNAINVDQVKDIPVDYEGAVGVPITFVDKYSPDQFEILGLSRYTKTQGMSKEFVEAYYKSGQTGTISEGHPDLCYYGHNDRPVVPYMRVLIKNKKVIK